jgi:hypothetical protein
LKKPASLVRFWFYKQKTKPNLNRAKQKKTESNRKNRAKPVWTGFCPNKPNQTETGYFDPFRFFLNNFCLVIFFYKNRIEQKIITRIQTSKIIWIKLQLVYACNSKTKTKNRLKLYSQMNYELVLQIIWFGFVLEDSRFRDPVYLEQTDR